MEAAEEEENKPCQLREGLWSDQAEATGIRLFLWGYVDHGNADTEKMGP